MRVTQNMMSNMVLSNLSRSRQGLQTLQNQLSTGLAVTKPSDNPLATSQIMSLRTSLDMHDQYYGNMQSASSFMSVTDSALSDFVSSLQQVRSLMLDAANGTNNASDLNALGLQVNQIIGQLVQTGSAMYGNQYIFSGTQTTTVPLAITADADGNITKVTYQGDGGQINYEVAQGVQMTVNTDGAGLFQVAGTGGSQTNLFDTLITIKDDMLNDTNTQDLGGTLLSQIDEITSHIESAQASVGVKEDRLNTAMTRSQNEKTSMSTMLSSLQDVDVAQATVEFSEKSYVYQAALATAAKVLTPTLVDYLK